jgi:hypothetical protein
MFMKRDKARLCRMKWIRIRSCVENNYYVLLHNVMTLRCFFAVRTWNGFEWFVTSCTLSSTCTPMRSHSVSTSSSSLFPISLRRYAIITRHLDSFHASAQVPAVSNLPSSSSDKSCPDLALSIQTRRASPLWTCRYCHDPRFYDTLLLMHWTSHEPSEAFPSFRGSNEGFIHRCFEAS